MQFTNSCLDALVKNLSDNDFKYLSQEFSREPLKLVTQKGVYLYEYMNSFKNLLKINCLIDVNFSVLQKWMYYLYAWNNVWNVFKMNAIVDYHDLYLKTDFLLSADVIEKFINTCLE